MTGGSQQLRQFRRAMREHGDLAHACEASGIAPTEAKLIVAEDAKNPPPAEAFELLGAEPVAPVRQFTDLHDAPPFHYRVIHADPAWDFNGGGDRNARNHYDCMSIEAIQALPVGEVAAGDCALFLWVTDPFLEIGIATLRKWGFRYASVAFHWAKRTKLDAGWHMGTGYGTRANVETCLLGMMGQMRLPKNRDVRRLIVEPLREHSRKPDRVATDIERLYDGPYLEMFARTQRPGWDAWGNQTDKFEMAA